MYYYGCNPGYGYGSPVVPTNELAGDRQSNFILILVLFILLIIIGVYFFNTEK
ncbi:YjcZ family sporulation protein [Halalkalibacter okhensis]|uniref:YjcZ family sporulation protein n=1 Tax=Halalkalibacter okhensis TaxID=333138 RepID=UPI00126A7764|nr:YjcZ family sporulation protein [Halalkalibacter okhensis]